jgi:hypothetical protein
MVLEHFSAVVASMLIGVVLTGVARPGADSTRR